LNRRHVGTSLNIFDVKASRCRRTNAGCDRHERTSARRSRRLVVARAQMAERDENADWYSHVHLSTPVAIVLRRRERVEDQFARRRCGHFRSTRACGSRGDCQETSGPHVARVGGRAVSDQSRCLAPERTRTSREKVHNVRANSADIIVRARLGTLASA